MIQTFEKNVDKEGKISAAIMVFTCLKLLLSFKTFLKHNLRAFLTRAETSCESGVTLSMELQNIY
jgi:hypothetical protein